MSGQPLEEADGALAPHSPRHSQAWLSDPDYALTKATSTDASFGCFWCGGDLTQGTIWLDRESLADLKLALRR